MSQQAGHKKEKPEDKSAEREKRVEIGFLEVLIGRYPDAARRFVRKMQSKQTESQILVDSECKIN